MNIPGVLLINAKLKKVNFTYYKRLEQEWNDQNTSIFGLWKYTKMYNKYFVN